MTTTIKASTSKHLKEMDAAFKQLQESFAALRKDFLYQNHNANSNYCIGVSAGHSGRLNGKYLTKGKQFHHKGENLHNQGHFYEGVFNRIIADKFCQRLKMSNMVYKKFYHDFEDWSLKKKSDMVNYHHINVQKVILFELHSNSSKMHNAQGFSVYTSAGQTSSDIIATKIWEEMALISKSFGFRMRKQTYKDGDVDYEEAFWMCVKTACPSVLLECLFFDYLNDVRILMLESFQDAYVEALFTAAMWADKNI